MTNLPSSLAVIHSSALVLYTRPPVSVYGTGTVQINDSGFSWEPDYVHYPVVLLRPVLSGSTPRVDLPARFNIYTLQPPIPSGGRTFTSPSPLLFVH